MKDIKYKRTEYVNAVSVKFDNRRVTISPQKDEGFYLELRTIDKNSPKLEEYVDFTIVRDKMVVTGIRFSKEAAIVIQDILRDYLTNSYILDNI